jgi:hypothetical protein
LERIAAVWTAALPSIVLVVLYGRYSMAGTGYAWNRQLRAFYIISNSTSQEFENISQVFNESTLGRLPTFSLPQFYYT